MNAESEMHEGDGLGGEPLGHAEPSREGETGKFWRDKVEVTKPRTRDDIRKELERLGAEEVGEPGHITWEKYDERKADLMEEALDAPDADAERAEAALTQCQHIAYAQLLALEPAMAAQAGRLTVGQLRQLAKGALDALNRINSIAEGGAADPEFVAMLKADDR